MPRLIIEYCVRPCTWFSICILSQALCWTISLSLSSPFFTFFSRSRNLSWLTSYYDSNNKPSLYPFTFFSRSSNLSWPTSYYNSKNKPSLSPLPSPHSSLDLTISPDPRYTKIVIINHLSLLSLIHILL